MEQIYECIAERTGGNIYIGVVGPVRTGKSTLVKRIMEQLVIPNMDDPYRQERARDELPQSGSGKTIMTSEPKFVPEEAVEVSPDGKTKLRIRMIDSVGYMVDGAVGAEEDGHPRMVTTPWFDEEIPMTEAAELGTKKVMEEHASIGLVVTTDGSVTDIPRRDYEEAEARSIRDMQATGKPFLVVINSRNPSFAEAKKLKEQLYEKYGVDAHIADCQALDGEGISNLLRSVLYAFPMKQLHVYMPRWVDALETDHPVKTVLYQALLQRAGEIGNLAQAEICLGKLKELEQVLDFHIRSVDLATGTVSCALTFPETLFYEILSSKAGMDIKDDAQLLKLLTELSKIKGEYDKISDALSAVQATGYGVVMPRQQEMKLEKPEIIKKGSTYGVKLKAGAPSIHMIRANIEAQVAPIVGTEQQSEEMVKFLMHEFEEDPTRLWQTNMFGKSLHELVGEGLHAKLAHMPDDARQKLGETVERIINEGAGGLVCILL